MSTEAMVLDQSPGLSRPLRVWPLLAALLGLLALAWAVLHGLGDGGSQIRRLQVSGDFIQLSPPTLREQIEPFLSHGFFGVDLDAIRTALEAEPWIAQARVTRAWPDLLRVDLVEHRVAARWGERAALSTAGALFVPPTLDELPAALPRLDGPEHRVEDVLAAYMALSAQLEATPLPPRALRMDERGEWYLLAGPDIELRLGRELPRRQAGRVIHEVLPALADELERVEYIDLRYSNGFAVGWRPSARKEDAENG